MNTPETSNPHNTDAVIKREESILTGSTLPKNLLQQQMLLAEQLYRKAHPSEEIDVRSREVRNKIMTEWSDSTTSEGAESYSKAFRGLISHSGFAEHPRLSGDPMSVTLADVRFYVLNKSLPSE